MSATLHGTMTNQVYPVNLVVRFFTPGTQTEEHKACVPMAADANAFDIYGIPAGTYDVGIKALNTLSLLAASQTFTNGETTNVAFGTILFGDISADDYIDGSDSGPISANWHEWGGCFGYAGDWLMPPCPSPPPPGGACYGYIIG